MAIWGVDETVIPSVAAVTKITLLTLTLLLLVLLLLLGRIATSRRRALQWAVLEDDTDEGAGELGPSSYFLGASARRAVLEQLETSSVEVAPSLRQRASELYPQPLDAKLFTGVRRRRPCILTPRVPPASLTPPRAASVRNRAVRHSV